MQNIKKDLKDTILIYENSIKEITSQKDAFILLVDLENSMLNIPTLSIDIPIKSNIEGIIFECYKTKVTKITINARRNAMYRQKIDNFIDAKIKDLLLIPIFDDTEDKDIIAIIWVATEYKSQDEFTSKDISYIEKLTIDVREKIILYNQKIPVPSTKIESSDFDDRLNILIIDDSPIMVRFIEFILNDYHTHIITASNSGDGIEKFKYKKVDIVFIDEMTQEVGGEKTIEAIRKIEIEKRFDSIPIFSITSDISHKIKNRLLELGANIVLHKPIERDDIIKAIEEFRILKLK